jgi:hypothetical protein
LYRIKNKEKNEVNISKLMSFYLCDELNCKRKYKTKPKLIDHILSTHQRIIEEGSIGEPVVITNETKKNIDDNHQKQIKKHNKELKKAQIIKDLQEKEELLRIAKEKSNELFKNEQIEMYRQLELKKITQQNQQIELEQKKQEIELKWVTLIAQIQQNYQNNTEDCCICFENPVNTAPTPCGHLNFCYTCIYDYSQQFKHKGCPICKTPIKSVNKIYQ